jgi:hypothetical protein
MDAPQVASQCSQCKSPLRAGELVGLHKDLVLCCMCLDLKTSTLSVIDRTDESEETLDHPKELDLERSPPQKSI